MARPALIFAAITACCLFITVDAVPLGQPDKLELRAEVLERFRQVEEAAAKNKYPCPITLIRVRPDFPESVDARTTKGWVLVGFAVNEIGVADDPFVLASHPIGVFEKAAIEIIGLYKFKPVISDGRPRKFEYLVERVDFIGPGETPGRNWPDASVYVPASCSDFDDGNHGA